MKKRALSTSIGGLNDTALTSCKSEQKGNSVPNRKPIPLKHELQRKQTTESQFSLLLVLLESGSGSNGTDAHLEGILVVSSGP